MRKRPFARLRAFAGWAASLALTALGAAACSVNPATGERQLALVSESGEVEIGREADEEISTSMGLYADDAMQAYVQDMGERLAASSERPDLPWTFRVLDDPVVNAFALPGGYIYVTRGILAHLDSEAELASVIGHEIGHVTARHSVNQMSKQQLFGLGLGIGMVVSPELAAVGDLAQAGLGLLFLKYSRDDERQADELGLRYMTGASYDPRESAEVFQVLERVSGAQAGDRAPAWLSTHPDPGARAERIAQAVSRGELPADPRIGSEEYAARLDGLVYGENPREGFFDGERFIHPDLALELEFPAGWKTANQRQRVIGVSPAQDGILQLTLVEQAAVEAASQAFLREEGVTTGRTWRRNINNLQAVWATFKVPSETRPLAGRVAHVSYGGKVYQLLGYSLEQVWVKHEGSVDRSLESFQRLTDPELLAVQPARLEMVSTGSEMAIEQLEIAYPSSLEPEEVALLNRLDPSERLPAGAWFKQVQGGLGELEDEDEDEVAPGGGAR